MISRPKLKIHMTFMDKIIECLAWLSLIILWSIVLWNYSELPEIIPSHFNALGKVDDYSRKESIFVLPIIGTLLFLGLTISNKYPHIFNYPKNITLENAAIQYTNATRMLRFSKFIILLIFLFIIAKSLQIASGKSVNLGVWFLPLVLALLIIPSVFFLIKSLRN